MSLLPAFASLASGIEPPDGFDALYGSRRVALVVGVDVYDDPALGGLRYPSKDAQDMAAVLRDDDAGDFDSVRVLHGDVDADTFWDAFRSTTSDLARDDLFLLFIAGHGTLRPQGGHSSELYFLPSDAILDRYERTAIRMESIEDGLEGLEARRRVLMLDACH